MVKQKWTDGHWLNGEQPGVVWNNVPTLMCVSHQHLIKMTSKLIFIARRSGFQIGILTDGFFALDSSKTASGSHVATAVFVKSCLSQISTNVNWPGINAKKAKMLYVLAALKETLDSLWTHESIWTWLYTLVITPARDALLQSSSFCNLYIKTNERWAAS